MAANFQNDRLSNLAAKRPDRFERLVVGISDLVTDQKTGLGSGEARQHTADKRAPIQFLSEDADAGIGWF
jgi:hypothetical protein